MPSKRPGRVQGQVRAYPHNHMGFQTYTVEHILSKKLYDSRVAPSLAAGTSFTKPRKEKFAFHIDAIL